MQDSAIYFYGRQAEYRKLPMKCAFLSSAFFALRPLQQNIILLVMIYFKILSIEEIVGIANTFFIGNALLGLAASIRYMNEYWVRAFILILIITLVILLAFSSIFAWIALAGVTVVSIYKDRRVTNKKDKNGYNT